MTNNEAIKFLSEIMDVLLANDSWLPSTDNPIKESFGMAINALTAQPEITDEQAIKHLRESGWMQNHDKQMYEMGLREQLADDSDSYDALLPPARLIAEIKIDKDELEELVAKSMSNVAQPEIIHCRECKYHIDGFFCQVANHHTSDKDCCAIVFGAERRKG